MLEDLLTPSKWQFGWCQKVSWHHARQHKNILILGIGVNPKSDSDAKTDSDS